MSKCLEGSTAVHSAPVGVQDDEYLIEQLIGQIQAGHESAVCQLREFLGRGVRWYLNRNASVSNLEASTGRVLDKVVLAIRANRVSNLAELATFTRQSARQVGGAAPEALMGVPVPCRSVGHMKTALYELDGAERDALLRYFDGHDPERICADLQLSEGAVDRLRGRIRARYASLCTHC